VVEARNTSSSSIEMWGDGSARREFTYVDDLAEYIIESLVKLETLPVVMNVGSGIDYSVSEYYGFVMDALKVQAELKIDTSKPVGMSQKLLDVSVARSNGWNPRTHIISGIASTITWYLNSNGIIFEDD
jgi:GDP-L-fucose synthase